MSGHRVTPYELIATRKHARKNKDVQLLLAAVGPDDTVDVLDAVEQNILSVPELVNRDETQRVSCVAVKRDGEYLAMVFASEISGEREIVRDGTKAARPLRLVKERGDVAAFYSCCLLWRPPAGERGVLLVHSPWGRGGSRAQVLKLMQKAVDMEEKAKAKLRASPMIPVKMLERFIKQAKVTKIVYSRSTGVSSTFGDQTASAPAEEDLVIRGSRTATFRDGLAKVLQSARNRDQLFTLRVRDEDVPGGYREEVFEDVSIGVQTPGGVKTYSIKDDTVPTLGFDITPEVNNVYYGLPTVRPGDWPSQLVEGMFPELRRLALQVVADS